MKSVFILLPIIVIGGILVVFAKASSQQNKKNQYSYYKRKPLSDNEQIMYWRLVTALPNHVVLAQVGMTRCLGTKTRPAFLTIAQKSLDFVVCNKGSEIIAAIEIDDKSHNSNSRRKADETKSKALENAGIKCIRWPASKLPSETEIKLAIDQLTGAVANQQIQSA